MVRARSFRRYGTGMSQCGARCSDIDRRSLKDASFRIFPSHTFVRRKISSRTFYAVYKSCPVFYFYLSLRCSPCWLSSMVKSKFFLWSTSLYLVTCLMYCAHAIKEAFFIGSSGVLFWTERIPKSFVMKLLMMSVVKSSWYLTALCKHAVPRSRQINFLGSRNSVTLCVYRHGVIIIFWTPPFILCAKAVVPCGQWELHFSLVSESVTELFSQKKPCPFFVLINKSKVPLTVFSDR